MSKAHLVLLPFALLCFTDVAVFFLRIEGKTLITTHYCGDLKPNSQYVQGMPVLTPGLWQQECHLLKDQQQNYRTL